MRRGLEAQPGRAPPPRGATCLTGDLSRRGRGGDRPSGTGGARELGACAAQATFAAVGRPRGAAATWPAPPRLMMRCVVTEGRQAITAVASLATWQYADPFVGCQILARGIPISFCSLTLTNSAM